MGFSGVQRFLDGRGNELLGCPGQGKSLNSVVVKKIYIFREMFHFFRKFWGRRTLRTPLLATDGFVNVVK